MDIQQTFKDLMDAFLKPFIPEQSMAMFSVMLAAEVQAKLKVGEVRALIVESDTGEGLAIMGALYLDGQYWDCGGACTEADLLAANTGFFRQNPDMLKGCHAKIARIVNSIHDSYELEDIPGLTVNFASTEAAGTRP